MKQIGELFTTYQARLKPPQASVERVALDCINRTTGISLNLEQVTYNPHTQVVFVQAPAVVKSELSRQKSALKSAFLAALGPDNSPKEIL